MAYGWDGTRRTDGRMENNELVARSEDQLKKLPESESDICERRIDGRHLPIN